MQVESSPLYGRRSLRGAGLIAQAPIPGVAEGSIGKNKSPLIVRPANWRSGYSGGSGGCALLPVDRVVPGRVLGHLAVMPCRGTRIAADRWHKSAFWVVEDGGARDTRRE